MNIELEERAKLPPDPGPKILPAQKLSDTASLPPIESIPRTPLPSMAEATPDFGHPGAETPEVVPVIPEVPSQNA
jgi:hypothetical protein